MMPTRLASAVALALGWLAFAQGAGQERRNTRPPSYPSLTTISTCSAPSSRHY